MNRNMLQYGVWPNCTNNCDFCLRLNRETYTKEQQLFWLSAINENIKNINWKQDFPYGISLLGGELFYIQDKDIQNAFMQVIQTIIEYVLIDELPHARFSTVTNGLYKPNFLYHVIDYIKERVGIERCDVNFSYDLKYRYKTEAARLTALNNILSFQKRYNYAVGVQMILTQYVIDLWKQGQFDANEFCKTVIPGCQLAFLYPHPVHTGKVLSDFNFRRTDFLQFVQYLKRSNYAVYYAFVNSTKNSGTFKYTGLRFRHKPDLNKLKTQQAVLSDGKEVLSDCGHSTLYRCYADSDKCVLCDLQMLDSEL